MVIKHKAEYAGVHTMLSGRTNDGTPVLLERGRVIARAAALYLQHNHAETVIFSTGTSDQPISHLMENEVKRWVVGGRTIARPQTMNTGGEIDAFLSIARPQSEVPNLVSIADKLHAPLIRSLYARRYYPNIPVVTTDDIIEAFGDDNDKESLRRLKLSTSQISLGVYQLIVRGVVSIADRNYHRLSAFADSERGKFTHNPWPERLRFIPSVDPYVLEPAPALLRPLVKFFQ